MPVLFAADAFHFGFPNTPGCAGCTQLAGFHPNLSALVLSSEVLAQHSPGCEGWDVTDCIARVRANRP